MTTNDMPETTDWVVTWENPDGLVRHEQEWFATEYDARNAIALWEKKWPWNTYVLSRTVAYFPATAQRPKPPVYIYTQPPGG